MYLILLFLQICAVFHSKKKFKDPSRTTFTAGWWSEYLNVFYMSGCVPDNFVSVARKAEIHYGDVGNRRLGAPRVLLCVKKKLVAVL